jgi:inhibitor of cysteine peptidase
MLSLDDYIDKVTFMMKIFYTLLTMLAFSAFGGSETLLIQPGQGEVVLSIPANPSTGYIWKLKKYDEFHFNLVGQGFLKPGKGLVGQGGQAQFIFKIIKPFNDVQRVKFELVAPWDKEPVQTKTFLISVMEETITAAE